MVRKALSKINAFQLAMITLAYVASVRVLPTLAEYGFTAIFYYFVGAFSFLIPSALVSAELGTAMRDKGGIYSWVSEALGTKFGFFSIWAQFLSNIFALPAFLSFLAATGSYIFMPELANNKYFLLFFILIIWWCSTFASFFGMKAAGWINTIGFFVATFIPTIVILLLGAFWWYGGNEIKTVISFKSFFPDFSGIKFNDLAFLAGVLFSLTGMEVSGAHASDVENVGKTFPKGMFIASILVLLIGFASLSISLVIPKNELSLVAGFMQALSVFFEKFHISWAVKIMAAFIVGGGIFCLNSSVIGPAKGLFGSAKNGEIPQILAKVNKHGMPVNMFIAQGIGVSLISLLFLLMPSVSSSYWLIMAVVTILYLFMYVLLFISGIVLRYKKNSPVGIYRIPLKKIGMWIVAGVGILSSIFGIVISFFPPSQISVGSIVIFETVIVLGILFFIGAGLFLHHFRKKQWKIDA